MKITYEMRITRWLFLSLILAFYSFPAYAQKSSEELGRMAYSFFKTNQLDHFYQLVISQDDLYILGKWFNLDSNSAELKMVIQNYPTRLDSFKHTCVSLRNDTAIYNFGWAESSLKTIMTFDRSIADTTNKETAIYIVKVFITCGNKTYALNLDDVCMIDGIWKTGDSISFEQIDYALEDDK